MFWWQFDKRDRGIDRGGWLPARPQGATRQEQEARRQRAAGSFSSENVAARLWPTHPALTERHGTVSMGRLIRVPRASRSKEGGGPPFKEEL
jgi:hypothetical protein